MANGPTAVDSLDAALIAPDEDVQACAEAVAALGAGFGEPGAASVEPGRGCALGHKDDACCGDAEAFAQFFHLAQVGFVLDDELEVRILSRREVPKRRIREALESFVAGMAEFG